MTRLSTSAAALVLLTLATGAQAQGRYDGWYWNRTAAYWQGRDLWGNGPYGEGQYSAVGPNSTVLWNGPGTYHMPVNTGAWIDTPTSVQFESAPAGGQWGDTYSGGRFTLPAAAAFPSVVKASFHLYSVLGENPGGEMTFTNADVSGHFYTDNSQMPREPLYWRIDWRMDIEGSPDLTGRGTVGLLGQGGSFGEGVGSFSGIFDTVPQGWGTQLVVPFGVESSASDRGGIPAVGRVDVWVDVHLSRAPIVAVPEPGSWAMMLAGATLLGWRRWRATIGA